MNLHGMVAGYVGAINPRVPGQLLRSTGYSTDSAGKRTPTYATAQTVYAQVQAVTGKDLQQLDAINIQGVLQVAYLNGNIEGLVRVRQMGGDLLQIPQANGNVNTYLITAVLERWPDWCKVAITLQDQ